MKILVTGNTSFIGKHLTQFLEKEGHTVVGFSRSAGGDIRNVEDVSSAVKGVDVVYHLVAELDIKKMSSSVEAGYEALSININGTHNIAYACAQHSAWLVYVSSVFVYGALDIPQNALVEESQKPNPQGLYPTSKYIGEQLVQEYGNTYKVPWTIARLANVYGPGMPSGVVISTFLKQAMANEAISIQGDGTQTRSFVYIDDVVNGLVDIIKNPEQSSSEIFNIASNETLSINNIASDIVALTNSQSTIAHTEQRGYQIQHNNFSLTKAQNLLQWKTNYSWDEGLKKTYDWLQGQ